MSDINAIRREIDGLHANSTPGPWKVLHQTGGDFAGVIAGEGSRRRGTRPDIAYMANGSGSPDHLIIGALFNAWPAISQALADAEADRRKARAFDAIAERRLSIVWEQREKQAGWIAGSSDERLVYRFNPDLLTAIEAALAAKEQSK